MSKIMGIYVKFTKTTHSSCHVTLASNSENFDSSHNSALNVRKSYQIWGKLAKEQKLQANKQIGGGTPPPPPPPSAYRVKASFKL